MSRTACQWLGIASVVALLAACGGPTATTTSGPSAATAAPPVRRAVATFEPAPCPTPNVPGIPQLGLVHDGTPQLGLRAEDPHRAERVQRRNDVRADPSPYQKRVLAAHRASPAAASPAVTPSAGQIMLLALRQGPFWRALG
jgi:hypothetical protein